MRHLSREDLLARADGGTLPPQAEAHLLACADCREQVAALESTLRRLGEVEVPEPSPLFWDGLASRVRAAVAEQPAPRRGGLALPGWRWWAPASGLAAAVVALVVAVGGPSAPPAGRAMDTAAWQAATASDDEAADAWAVVMEAASSDDWAEGDDLGLEPASAESVATTLSAEDEARLLQVLNEALTAAPR